MDDKRTLGIKDVVQGEYHIYLQIKRPDGARCGFRDTIVINDEKFNGITRCKNALRDRMNKVTTAARLKAAEIMTANVKRVTQEDQEHQRPT